MSNDIKEHLTNEECMKFIDDAILFGSKLGLERIIELMKAMDNPQDKLKFIHVAGTNGKGSTVSYISSILAEAGYKVGVFTSPYLQRFSERIKISEKIVVNNEEKVVTKELSDEDLSISTLKCKKATDIVKNNGFDHPTFFEILTAIAFSHFYDNNCDIVVLEVGLGGILDSTNIIKTPLVSVITAIDYDHTRILGSTLTEIAKNKAGIIKENGIVVSYPQDEEAEIIIKEACNKKKSTLVIVDLNNVEIIESDIYHQVFNYKRYKCFTNTEIKILGNYQCINASLAIECCKILNRNYKSNLENGLKIENEHIFDGLKNTRWTGRMEIISKNPTIMLDVAHNPHGSQALYSNLKTLFKGKTFLFIIGCLADKDYEAMFKPFISLQNIGFLTTTPDSNRAIKGDALAETINDLGGNATYIEELPELMSKAYELTENHVDKDDVVICAFGSMYFVGELRTFLENN